MADLIAGMQNYSIPYAKAPSPSKNNQPSSGTVSSVKQPGKEITTTTKVLIGTGLTALAAAGIYLATRGKKIINTAPVKEAALQTIDNFKSIGKFVKGKAITNSGENFTGLLTKDLKDGTKLVLNYKDGILQSSSKLKGETEIYEKIFAHNEKGVLTNVIKNGENVFNKTISPYGKITAIGTNGGYVKNTAKNVMKVFSGFDKRTNYFYKNGKRVFVASRGNAMNGVGVYKPDGKTLDYGFDPKTHKFLAEDGTIIDELSFDGLGRIKENGWDRLILKREGCCVNPKHYGKKPQYPMPHADTVSTPAKGEAVLQGSDYYGRYFEHGRGSLVDAGGKKIDYQYLEGLKVPLKGKHVSEGFEIDLRWTDPSCKTTANVYELGNGKFQICGKNESINAIFDSKTNTFESLEGISKEDATGWLDTALEIQRHFKKDLSVMRQAFNAQQKAKAELGALRDLIQY